jgi:aerobic-type carbon monoxide dehydrogenase small subunit (CoxS/CutS family)
MARYAFQLNGRGVSADLWDPAQPLLYVLRGALALHGQKLGMITGTMTIDIRDGKHFYGFDYTLP